MFKKYFLTPIIIITFLFAVPDVYAQSKTEGGKVNVSAVVPENNESENQEGEVLGIQKETQNNNKKTRDSRAISIAVFTTIGGAAGVLIKSIMFA